MNTAKPASRPREGDLQVDSDHSFDCAPVLALARHDTTAECAYIIAPRGSGHPAGHPAQRRRSRRPDPESDSVSTRSAASQPWSHDRAALPGLAGELFDATLVTPYDDVGVVWSLGTKPVKSPKWSYLSATTLPVSGPLRRWSLPCSSGRHVGRRPCQRPDP